MLSVIGSVAVVYFFFFQAEDGIRDGHVTGVQTCALPIWRAYVRVVLVLDPPVHMHAAAGAGVALDGRFLVDRSEERRVGKECRARWSTEQEKKKQQGWREV